MATVDPIKIKGVREFQKALKDMDGETQKQLRVVFNSVAETIASATRRKVPSGPSGKAKGSVKVASSQREAKVKAGGNKAPYYPWLDFGGKTGRNKSIKRRFLTDGRYMYPTYRANRDSIQKALEKGLVDLARNAGLEVD